MSAEQFNRDTGHLSEASWKLLFMIIPVAILVVGSILGYLTLSHKTSVNERYEICRTDAREAYMRCSNKITGFQKSCDRSFDKMLALCEEDRERRFGDPE